MDDWDAFLTGTARRFASADVGEPGPWRRGPVTGLPELSALLSTAAVTPVVVDGEPHELVTWGSGDARRGWFCPAPPAPSDVESLAVHAVHAHVLAVFGGIRDVFGDVGGRWSPNHGEILTGASVEFDLAGTLDAYAWAWEDEGLPIPINAADFYVVAQEANGNLTIAGRRSGRVLLFAPDHDDDDVTEMDGCPPYSLYTLDGIADFGSWIESNARAWRRSGD